MPNGHLRQVFGGRIANCGHSKFPPFFKQLNTPLFDTLCKVYNVLKFAQINVNAKKSHFWIPREISGKRRKKRVARQYGMMNNLSPKWWRGYQVSNMLWIMLDRVLVYWWNSIELHQWSVIFSTHWVIVKWNVSYDCIHFSAKVFHDVSSSVTL